jgi:hypothetical protein
VPPPKRPRNVPATNVEPLYTPAVMMIPQPHFEMIRSSLACITPDALSDPPATVDHSVTAPSHDGIDGGVGVETRLPRDGMIEKP